MQHKTDMILVIGEVLYDVFPETRRAGGAPFNFASHLIQMGFRTKFVTRLGADEDGRRLLERMQRSGFDLQHVQIDDVHKTGRVMVYPDQSGGHRFDILRDVAYDYIVCTEAVLELLQGPLSMIYFGSLVQRTATGRRLIDRICRSRSPETIVFYDVNLRPGCYSREIIQHSLHHADILKLNDEELDVITEMFGLTGQAGSIVDALMCEYNLTLVALTKGAQGSEVFTAEEHVIMPLNHDYDCVDTVGAGDAFAAVLAAGYLGNTGMRQVLATATEFAGRICGIPGAVPEDSGFYRRLPV
jgi:fructokinase